MRRSLYALSIASSLTCFLGTASAEPPETPAAPPSVPAIAGKMTAVAGDLAKTNTGELVQREQKGIVRDLDELIASLEKQCEDCKGGMKRNNPRRGLADSVIRRGTGGIGALVDPGKSEKDWAKLSSRERDRILQSMSEGFPPEYRLVLERYYRRLAEEKRAPASGEGAQPKPAAPQSVRP